MASNDSGLDTSNDSSSAPDTSIINLRQMEQSIANYVTIMEPPFGISRSYADIREASGDDYERPRNTSVPIRYRCRRRDDKYERDRSSRVGLNVPYSTIYTKENRLRMAASVCNTELLDRLLEAGVNPDAADEHSRSPLHISASRGYTQIVKSLLAHGANPNAQDTLGNTPLHLAVCSASSYNFNKVVRMLIQHGCNVTITDRTGKTAVDLAKSKLLMMRTRLGQNSSSDSAQLFVEMSMLTGLLHSTLTKQKGDMKQFDDLEARLRNLTTKEIEDGADQLLTDVAGMAIN